MQSIIARKKLQHSSQCQIYVQRITCRYDQTVKSKQLNVEYIYIYIYNICRAWEHRCPIYDQETRAWEISVPNVCLKICEFCRGINSTSYKLRIFYPGHDLQIPKQVDVRHILHPEFVQADTIFFIDIFDRRLPSQQEFLLPMCKH